MCGLVAQNCRGRGAAALNECDMLGRVMIEPMGGWRVPNGMRPPFLLFALLLATAVAAQPVDRPCIHARLEPSIGHARSCSGAPSAPLYHLSDTIVVRITGSVKLDGSCSGGTPLYGFQRKEGDAWVDHLPPCNVLLCCGMSSAEWVQHTVGLDPAHVAIPGRGRPWKPGEYRVVVLLVGEKELMGPAFTVVEGE